MIARKTKTSDCEVVSAFSLFLNLQLRIYKMSDALRPFTLITRLVNELQPLMKRALKKRIHHNLMIIGATSAIL